MILENDVCKVEISNQGAEIYHFLVKKSNKEWMWDGNPSYWDQHNPILFPIIGSTYDKKIHLGKETYEMGNHGFARRAVFETVESSHKHCVLLLRSNEDTLKQYPFAFKLWVRYELKECALTIRYTIENDSTCDMPFSFGLHPAFMTSNNGINGSQMVHFPNQETNLPESILDTKSNSLIFTDAFFEKTPTLLLENVSSAYVVLVDGLDRMKVSVMGYKWLAFWKKPAASFICIEPWLGHSDFEEINCDFSEREGTLILAPHRSFVINHYLEASINE